MLAGREHLPAGQGDAPEPVPGREARREGRVVGRGVDAQHGAHGVAIGDQQVRLPHQRLDNPPGVTPPPPRPPAGPSPPAPCPPPPPRPHPPKAARRSGASGRRPPPPPGGLRRSISSPNVTTRGTLTPAPRPAGGAPRPPDRSGRGRAPSAGPMPAPRRAMDSPVRCRR